MPSPCNSNLLWNYEKIKNVATIIMLRVMTKRGKMCDCACTMQKQNFVKCEDDDVITWIKNRMNPIYIIKLATQYRRLDTAKSFKQSKMNRPRRPSHNIRNAIIEATGNAHNTARRKTILFLRLHRLICFFHASFVFHHFLHDFPFHLCDIIMLANVVLQMRVVFIDTKTKHKLTGWNGIVKCAFSSYDNRLRCLDIN